MAKSNCPKCGSEDILVGNTEEPNRCAECEHKWDFKPAPVIASENIIRIKSPTILMTINQDLRRKTPPTVFESKLLNKLKEIK